MGCDHLWPLWPFDHIPHIDLLVLNVFLICVVLLTWEIKLNEFFIKLISFQYKMNTFLFFFFEFILFLTYEKWCMIFENLYLYKLILFLS